jgi:hypothetical protein
MELTAQFYPRSYHRQLFENFRIGLYPLKRAGAGNLYQYVVSASVDIYDATGANVVTAAAMTVDGSCVSALRVFYDLKTGSAGRPITTAGTYRAVYTVLLSDTSTSSFEQNIIIEGKPSAGYNLIGGGQNP